MAGSRLTLPTSGDDSTEPWIGTIPSWIKSVFLNADRALDIK